MTSLNDIRSTFLDYFEQNDHEVVESSPLVPRNDPTLMFVNSGMVQFKNLFTGLESREYARAATSQKCVRAGGKHNDLDNVGYTARHHTFFEMLGNFSFGDYFKNEAIPLAWNLLTGDFGIDRKRLLVTVYHTDDEAADIWQKMGLPEDRIIRIETDDNFWQMGPTGPCGPCTEIFFDHGDRIWGGPPGSAEEDGDRFIEIWNIVFMQNERFEDGTMRELEMQSIDTGMGLERIGALLQGKHDNYDTDTMRALIEASASATNADADGPENVHHRVVADHLRSTSFLIADGVMPSNEGRGYVLRRIMRRAMRHARMAGATDPVMHRLVPALVTEMGQAYPALARAQALIEETLKNEEIRFLKTLDRGLRLLDQELERLPDGTDLPADAAFKLYDTFGFPLDLTQDALREKGRGVDTEGFDAAMEEQKARAREAWTGSGESKDATVWFDISGDTEATEFLGYETETAEGQIIAVVRDGGCVDSLSDGETGWVVTNQTPFYGEAGGQAGDTGTMQGTGDAKDLADVTDAQRFAGGRIIGHQVTVKQGKLATGDPVVLKVGHARRSAIRANHSATHLLHESLRQVLGEHVAQKGSLNASDRLRFDFSHQSALTLGELKAVETEVNAYIRQNSPVETRIMTPDDARAIGAQALFGEKYGDEVRVVSMGFASTGKGTDGNTWSIELCGGTHVSRTGDIGVFVTLGDSASSAGVRRIEALTGEAAFRYLSDQDHRLAETALLLKAPPDEVPMRVKALQAERRALQGEVAELRQKLALADGEAEAEAESVNGMMLHARTLKGVDGKSLPSLIDEYKARLGSGAVLLIADTGGKAAVAAGVTEDLIERLSAVDMVRAAVAELGGKGGGGRADMARGGAASADKAEDAIAAVRELMGA
ncbi:MAG: alanine--tRNA ligase [Boseongicola sp. SB0675_bin_26]|nr:alanine--tRNA ligase [Boseongicola sp. SB0675_bin_26]